MRLQILCSLLVTLAKPSILAANNLLGVVQLDSLNFDKVLARFDHVLIKFGQFYAGGDKHKIFGELATLTTDRDNLLLAEVRLKDAKDDRSYQSDVHNQVN